jgi:DNA replicative helicase MCM subunit Mcm2 (Cdc46/Mcm family)
MEQQTVCSAKASVVGKLNARTTVICACNPITPNQKYDSGLDLQVNTGLSIPLLTRFDLILIVKDENTRMEDSTKCDHILQKFTGE